MGSAAQPKHRVIRVDLPAFGLTGPRPDADYSIAAYVRFVVALLDALQVTECALAGNSLGGQIAWNTAANPSATRTQTGAGRRRRIPLLPESVPIGFQLARMPIVRDVMQYMCYPWPGAKAACAMSTATRPRSRRSWWTVTTTLACAQATARLAGAAPAAAAPVGRGCDSSHPPAHLDPLGHKDRFIPQDHAQRFAHDLPSARLHLFEGLGHVPHEEDPLATVAVVQGFLEQP